MKVICINDDGRPDDIPTSKWIVKDETYTVVKFLNCVAQPGNPVCFVLEEIDLKGCGNYIGFDSKRFAPVRTEALERYANMFLEEIA
jgi:hypothetical protein